MSSSFRNQQNAIKKSVYITDQSNWFYIKDFQTDYIKCVSIPYIKKFLFKYIILIENSKMSQ